MALFFHFYRKFFRLRKHLAREENAFCFARLSVGFIYYQHRREAAPNDLSPVLTVLRFVFAESLISRFSIQGELGVTANWTQYTSRQSAKEIDFEYRVTCAANYYGPGCGTLCRERDDNFGHIACSASGQKICLSGWQGEYCTERKCC